MLGAAARDPAIEMMSPNGLSLAVPLAVAATLAVPGSAAAAKPPAAVSGSWLGHATVTPTANSAVIGLADNGQGHASHIGVFHIAGTETDNFLTNTVEEGAFTLTTPPGDTVTGTYSGVLSFISPTVVSFTSPGAITGGTGRFAGASGPITFTGTGDSVTLQIRGMFTATLCQRRRRTHERPPRRASRSWTTVGGAAGIRLGDLPEADAYVERPSAERPMPRSLESLTDELLNQGGGPVTRSPSELSRYVRERQARIERLQAEIRGDFNETLARALGAKTPKVRALRRAEREYEAAVDELFPRRGER